MGQLWEYVKMALSNIRMNRGRSFLTMLGIIIGVSSVILIMSIGNGAKAEMESELNSVAGGTAYIYANSNLDEVPVITEEDREALRELDHVKGVTSYTSLWTSVKTLKGNFDAIIDYGNPDSVYVSGNPDMLYGQWFTWDDYNAGRDVAVVGEADAIRMFGTADVVGLTFELDDGDSIKDVRIVGVKKALDGTFTSSGSSSYLDISMPMSSDSYWAEYNDFDSVYLFMETGYAKEATEKAISLLESRHGIYGEEAFLTEDYDSQIASIMSVLNMVTIFIMLVAAISLLVGGIGVMNIMLVSVTERTREIGIRKALGARTRSILTQFLAESAIITGIGGIIGIILGVAGAHAICSLPMVGFPPAVSVSTVVSATLFSCGVGIFFGIYPARKAAHLSPIEALRRN